ncbi:C1 family peptidase, partial [Elizabethkingia miricola]|uniref:C1 family peptidase n=1 Tax=Elizabethkingia miricola TaxID=172045 RepID=UPI00292A40F9
VVMGNLSYALDKNKNWKIGIWGASALANDSDGTHYKEINYYVQYSNKNFYIGLWDLYNSRNINTAVAADDHGMQIVGLAKDQTGKEYYMVKNSWGVTNDYQGYLYVTRPYVQYKSTGILVHKNAIPKDILNKLKPNTNIGL